MGNDFKVSLKVLSSEMDLAESGLIWWIFIKERGAEIFSKFRTPPMLWEPVKVTAASRTERELKTFMPLFIYQ